MERVRPAAPWTPSVHALLALPEHEPTEVVCHNDFAPYNLAFRDGLPVGAFDFEAASPGPRSWDLAHLAHRLVPLAHPANPDLPPQPDPAGRLAALCAAYGDIDPAAVLALVPPRLCELAETAPPAHAQLYRADATPSGSCAPTTTLHVERGSRVTGRG